MTQRWRCIQSTIGVAHLVCNGEEPAAVPDAVIDEIKGREDEHGFVHLDLRPRMSPGDKVRVVAGVFSECIGLFEALADRERVAILLDLLGRKVKIVVNEDFVAAA